MEKRTLMAVLLIGALSAGYFWYLNKSGKEEERAAQEQALRQQREQQQVQQGRPQANGRTQSSGQAVQTRVPQQVEQRAVVSTRSSRDLTSLFEPIAPGITTINQAINYVRNVDRLKELRKSILSSENVLGELNITLQRAKTDFEKNKANQEIYQIKRRLDIERAELKRIELPEVYNNVKTTPQDIAFTTDLYKGVFTTKGAVFKNLIYTKLYGWDPVKMERRNLEALNIDPSIIDPKVKPFLVSFDETGTSNENTPVYTYDEIESNRLSINGKISKVFYVRYFNRGKLFRLEKIFSFHTGKYVIDFSIRIINESEGENEIMVSNGGSQDGYYLFWGTGLGEFVDKKHRTSYDEEIRLLYYTSGEDGLREIDKKEKIQQKLYESQADWLGIDNRYFFIGFDIKRIKELATGENIGKYNKINYAVISREAADFQEKIMLSFFRTKLIRKGESRESMVRVYLGPKGNSSELVKAEIKGLEIVSDRGWAIFRPIAIGIKWLLMFLNSFVGNFGISIIFLTIIIKFLLHPLNKKSTESAKKMQLLQPKVQEINKQYAKDPQAKQKALMELYKKEGINPLGGCLPLLLQMPFFFALFQALPVIVELKDVSFLWIKDLSSPDTVLWGNFYITDQINILPILMTITSIIQTKVGGTSKGGDKRQQTMMMLLPVVFLFLFYKMPSGLVLYWTVQNIIQIIQQIFTNKKLERQHIEKENEVSRSGFKAVQNKAIKGQGKKK